MVPRNSFFFLEGEGHFGSSSEGHVLPIRLFCPCTGYTVLFTRRIIYTCRPRTDFWSKLSGGGGGAGGRGET